MKDSLKSALAAINKKNPNSIGTIESAGGLAVTRLSSGSHYLDWALGGGWAMGRIIELFGQPGSGKSTIAMKTIVESQKRGMDCAYIDAENAFDPSFAQVLGVDVDKLIVSQESGAEAVFEQIFKLLDGGCEVIVVDSVAALVPKATFDAEMEQAQIAMLARSMSRGLPLVLAHNKHNSLVIFINQLRMSPGAYGNPEITAGGKSLGYYTSNRVEVRKGDWIEEGTGNNKEKIGQQVKFKIAKNKTGIPYRTGYFNFLYSGEIDRVDELVSLGLETRKIGQRGAWYDIQGKAFNGRAALQAGLREDKQLYEAFAAEVLK